MIPPEFQYAAPHTIPEALALLQQNPDAKILSGGQSLIPVLKFRLATPPLLIDINRIGGLDYVREEGGKLLIGALVRECELDDSDIVRTKYPLLHETSRSVADPLVRNLATIAGNLAHADPANDHPATMLRLSRGGRGYRSQGQPDDSDRFVLYRPVRDGSVPRRDHHRGARARTGRPQRRRVWQAGTQRSGISLPSGSRCS